MSENGNCLSHIDAAICYPKYRVTHAWPKLCVRSISNCFDDLRYDESDVWVGVKTKVGKTVVTDSGISKALEIKRYGPLPNPTDEARLNYGSNVA